MSYQFTPEDREIQDRARQFVDEELIPWEVHAEMHAGEIPAEVKHRQEQLAHDLGLTAINQPLELGGPGYTTRQQALIMEQAGRVTNARQIGDKKLADHQAIEFMLADSLTELWGHA